MAIRCDKARAAPPRAEGFAYLIGYGINFYLKELEMERSKAVKLDIFLFKAAVMLMYRFLSAENMGMANE